MASTFEQRLQQFLEMEGLSQAQFADALGIQRGGLCHLLSGRNKPSYDFLVKLMNSFPTLNTEWLLAGKGKSYKESEAPSDNTPKTEPADFPTLFDRTAPEEPKAPEIQFTAPNIAPSQPLENRISAPRTIDHITIFYSDGTFEERR